MARSDLLIALVKASMSGDQKRIRSTVEAIVAEERSKQHNIFADRLSKAIIPNGNGGTVALAPSETSAKARDFIAEIVPKRRLDDLVLPDVCRRACGQLVEEQHRADVLRAHGIEPRHSVLLVGPPGNGKTSLAEALAEALAVPFFVVRYESMIGSYLGETAGRLKRVFDYARTTPCVLFFDEFDAIGKERGDLHETGEIKRVVTSLLMQVDELPSYTVVIAATNHSELLDRAVWRRFQMRLTLPRPNQPQLARYIEGYFKAVGEDAALGATAIARKLGPVSYAEAEQFCLDVRRRDILAMGASSLKDLVSDQLSLWAERRTARAGSEAKEGKGD